MTNLPTGTTETTPATRRRRLNRVITVSALAAGALTALAAPAQAATGWTPDQSHGTGFRAASEPRNPDCGNRPRDNGGRHNNRMSDFNRSFAGAVATCAPPSTAPTWSPTAPATTWSPTAPTWSPSAPAATAPSTSGTTRGATINYNEGYAGSCVYYALERFHQYTGVYPRAFGDARYLATGAAASGWATGSSPRINSLVVFQPGQNGAGSPTGHVAWVEQVAGNQIYIGEMNAPSPYVVTHRWMTPVSGVRYVYA
jgi:surface antigen